MDDFERFDFSRDFFGDLLPPLPPPLVLVVVSVTGSLTFSDVVWPEVSAVELCCSLSFTFFGLGSRDGERGREAAVEVGEWWEEDGPLVERDEGLAVLGNLAREVDGDWGDLLVGVRSP